MPLPPPVTGAFIVTPVLLLPSSEFVAVTADVVNVSVDMYAQLIVDTAEATIVETAPDAPLNLIGLADVPAQLKELVIVLVAPPGQLTMAGPLMFTVANVFAPVILIGVAVVAPLRVRVPYVLPPPANVCVPLSAPE